MMDFNLILLFVGLGLLAIVILFALWGFLGGLKRELACIGVFAVLLVLAWLVFGNSGVLLNYSGGLVDNLRDLLNLPAKDATVWETALDYLRSLEGLNLDKLLVEGKETYNLVYNISSAVVTMVLLIVSTLVVVIITPIIRLISHIVLLIIRGVKKRRAKKRAESGEEEVVEEEVVVDETAEDAVLVLKGSEGMGDAVVTLSENELPAPKKTKKRIWGAVAGALKGLFLIVLLFVPISGIYSVAKTATPETRELISDLVNGDTKKQTIAETQGPVDLAFGFVDAYEQSAVGQFVEGSSYFFGKSFSTLLFDSISTINTSKQSIKLREELTVFVEAINQLNGNMEIGTWTEEEVANALAMLKDSKLLPEAMPAVIEFVSVMDAVSKMLASAPGQEVAFLKLRELDWDRDLELVLDAVAEAYKLGIFPLEDFNYLTMDPEVLSNVVSILGDTEFLNSALPIIVKVGVNLDAIKELTGGVVPSVKVDNVDWKDELLSIVEIYETFQEYGYESLDEVTKAELEDLVNHLIVDNTDTTIELLEQLAELHVFGSVAVPVLQSVLNNFVENEYAEFANIINLNQLTVEDWKEDFKAIVEIAKVASTEINALSLKFEEMDIESPEAISAMKEIVKKVFDLNLLGDDDTKNALIHAAFEKFEIFNKEDLYTTDENGNQVSIFEGINWHTEGDNIGEVENIQILIDVYEDFINLEGVDLDNLQFNFEMLEDDATVDVIVNALETLVDSELVIASISPAVNKYVLPLVEDIDDDNLVSDIVGEIGSETAAHEIINIVKAIKSASKLGLFSVPEEGLAALNYTEVDAMKDIINVIFDSKLFVGYEGRIIRIIFKATKLLDVEKGLLNDINYDGEQEKLIAFIDEVTPILLDPDFKLTDDEGKVQLDLDYLLQQKIATRLLDAVEIILGTYERQSDGSTVEIKGSILVETLLPSIYSKYLKDLVPEDFKELVNEIIDIESLPGEVLASDIRRLVYIADQLILMDIQEMLVGKPLNYVASLTYIHNIVDALLNIKMFEHCGNEVFAWVINYVAEKAAGEIIIDKVSGEDFANVDWALEGETAKQLITDLVVFLKENRLTTTEELIDFINNKEYQTTGFVNVDNVNKILSIGNRLLSLQTIEVVLPIIFNGVMTHIGNLENPIVPNVWENNLTGAELVSDLRAILSIGDIVVNETDFIGYWQENFEIEIEIPEANIVERILDSLFSLNVIRGYEADLANYFLGKYLPEDFSFTVEDLQVESITDWANEFDTIVDLVVKALEILEDNGFETVQDITGTQFTTETILEYLTDENIGHVAGILEIVVNSKLVQNILPAVLNNVALPAANNAGYNIDFLSDLTSDELANDVSVIAQILRTVESAKIAVFFEKVEEGKTNLKLEAKLIDKLLANAQTILTQTRGLNLVTKHEADLTALLINEILELAKITDFTITAGDFDGINFEESASKIVSILDVVREVAKENEIVSYKDLVEYIDEVKADINVAITNENAKYAASIIELVAECDVIEAILPKVAEYGIDKVVEAGYDISFLRISRLSKEELASDLITIALIVVDAVNADAIAIYKGEAVSNINEEAVKGIVTKLGNLNLIGKYANEWNAFLVNFVLEKTGLALDKEYEAEDFAYITSEQRGNDAELLGQALVHVLNALDVLFPQGVTIDDVMQYVNEQSYKYTENLPVEAVREVFNAVSKITDLASVEMVVADLVDFATVKIPAGTLDLTFIEGKVVAELLPADLLVLSEVVVDLLNVGVLDIINGEPIAEFDYDAINGTFAQIPNIQILGVYAEDLFASLINFALEKVNIGFETRYTGEDFAPITKEEWINDSVTLGNALVDIINAVEILLAEDFTIDAVKAFIDEEKYMVAENLPDEAINLLFGGLSKLTSLATVQVMLPDFVEFGISKLPTETLDITFLNSEAVAENLPADLLVLADIVIDARDFGVLSLVKGNELDQINEELVAQVIDNLEELHIYNGYRANWWAIVIQKLYAALGLPHTVTADYFGIITEDMWKADNEQLQVVVRSLNNILTVENSLDSTTNIKKFINEQMFKDEDFLYDVLLSDANIDAVAYTVSELFKLNVIDAIDNDLINFVMPKLENAASGLQVSFIGDILTKEVISHDILNIAEIAKVAKEVGVIEYIRTKDIQNLEVSKLGVVFEQLNDMLLLQAQRNDWMALLGNALGKFALNGEVQYESYEFGVITNAHADAAIENVKAILTHLDNILDEWQIESLSELLHFIEGQGYLTIGNLTNEVVKEVTAIVTHVADIIPTQPLLPKLASFGLGKLHDTVDLSFVITQIENGTLTGAALAQDIKTLMSIVNDAVDFGAIALFYGDYEAAEFEIKFEYATSVVEKLEQLNILAADYSSWLAFTVNMALQAAKIDEEFVASDFAHMTEELWHQDFANLRAIVDAAANLVSANNLNTLGEILDFVNDKGYVSAQYVTEANVYAVLDLVDLIMSGVSVQPVYHALANYAIDQFVIGKEGLEGLEFINNVVNSENYTGASLVNDVKVITNIAREAVAFGAIELFYDQTMDEVELVHVSNVLTLIEDIELISLAKGEWAAFIFNTVFDLAKINGHVSYSEYVTMTDEDWLADHQIRLDIIDAIANLLETNNLRTYDDIMSFVNEKKYQLAQYVTEENVITLANIVEMIGSMKVLTPVLDDAALFGVQKVKGIDLSFLVDSLISNELSSQDLANDIVTIASMIVDVVDFGAIEYYFYGSIDEIQLDKLANAITKLNSLNAYTVAKADWLVLGVNQLMKAMAIDKEFVASDFAGINVDDEINHLVNIINYADDLLGAVNVVSTDDLVNFINDKLYLDGQYLTNEVLDIVVSIVEEVANMGTAKLVLPAIAEWGVNKLQGEDFDFLKSAFENDMFTADELVSDVLSVVEIARIAIELGISDIAFNIPVEELNGQLLANIIAKVEEINVFTKLRSNWVALGLNKALNSLGLSIDVAELDAFTEAEWKEDNQYLQNAVIALADAINELGIVCLSDVNNFINEGYLATSTYADNLLVIYNEVLANLIKTNTAGLIFDDLLDFVITKAAEGGFDIEFIRAYSRNSFVQDIPTVLRIAKSLVAFGALEYVKDKEISNIDVQHLANVVAELENLALFTDFRANWAALLITKLGGEKLGVEVTPADIDLLEAQWLEDNATMQALVLKLGEILDNNDLNSYSDVVKFIEDRKYSLEETYTDSNLALVSEALQSVLSLNTLNVIFPQLVDMAVEAARSVKLDISFLATSISMNNVKNDVARIINNMFRPIAKFGLFDIIEGQPLKFINLEYLNPVIDEFEHLEIYNISPAKWAASIINCIAYHANLGFTVLPSEFSSVVWSKENELLQSAITALDEFLVRTDLVLIANIQKLIENKFAPQEQYANNYTANLLLKALESVLDLQTINSIADHLVGTGLDKLSGAGIDLSVLLDGVTNEEIVEDVHSIISAVRDLLDFNIIDVLYRGAIIDYSNLDLVYSALDKVFNLNMMQGKDTVVVANIFDKLGIDTTDLRSGNIELDDELTTIKEIMTAAVEVFEIYGLDSLPAFAAFNFDQVKLDENTNELLRAVADIVFALSKDELVKLTYKGLSQKFVGDKLAGLADVHNIYSKGSEFTADLRDISNILNNVANLDVNGFINENKDYPINQKVFIDQIINKLFNLNYFNLPGRMSSFLNGLQTATGFDLSSIDGNNISLANDAAHIIEMYHYLAEVLGSESFPIKNKQDIDNKVSVSLAYFFEEQNFINEIKAIESYMNTTIYDETGALILLVLVPLLKNALPEYWAVLDLDNYNIDKISNDVPHFQAIFEIVMDMDPIGMHGGSLEFYRLGADVKDIIDHLIGLELLNNKGNALVELLLKDFVYYGALKDYNIDGGTFNIADVNFDNEGKRLGELVDQIIDVLISEGVHNINEVKAYFETFSFIELIKDQSTVEKLADIIEKVTEFDIVKYNLKQIYDIFAVPALEKANMLQYVDYRQSDNDELVAEVNYLADAAAILAEIGLGDILSGANINYDQADKVEELLTVLGKMSYAKYHADTYMEKYELTIKGIYMYEPTYEDLDVAGDLAKIADAYRALVPMLTDSNFAIKTIEDFKAIHKGTFIDNVKAHINEVADAYEYLANTSIAPYFYPTLVEKAKGLVPTSLRFVSDLLSVEELTVEQAKSDMVVSARLVKDLIAANVHEYLLDKTGLIPTQDVTEALINDVFDMYIFNTKFSAILEALMVKLNISTEDVDFDAIDWVSDKAVLVSELSDIYEFIESINIVTINDVLALRGVISSVSEIKAFILENLNSYNVRIALDVANSLLDTTVAKEVGLNLAKKVAGKVNLTGKLAVFNEILKLEKYSKESFNKEAKDGIALVDTFIESGLYENLLDRSLVIDWNNPYIETMIREFVELQLLPLYGQEIVEGVGSIFGKDLSTFDNSNVDYAGEQDAYVNAYNKLTEMLAANGFALKSVSDYLGFVRGTSSVRWTYFTAYEYAHIILDAFNELAGTGLANEGFKLVMSKLVKSGIPAAEYLDVTVLSRAEQDEDYATFISLAKAAVNFIYNDGSFERRGIDSSIENVDAALEIVDHIMALNIFEGKYSDIVLAFMLEYNIDTVEVNLSYVDYEYEAQLVKEAIVEVIAALNEYGITSAKELYATLKEFYSTLRTSKKQFLKDVRDMLLDIEVEHIIKVVEIADKSLLLDQILLPTYEKFVAKFVPARYQSYLSIEGYENEDLANDMHLLAEGLRKVYDSEAYKVYTQNRVLNASEIALVQEAIVILGQMNILEVKKADVISLIDRFISQLDLSNLDVNTIVVADEAQVVANMFPALHTLYVDTNRFYLSISMMGDEDITNAIISVYENALTSKFIRAALPSMVRNIVISRVSSALGTTRYDDVTDEQILDLLDDGVDALYALREMGVFSNNGIDLTNKALTDRVFAVITENIPLGKYGKYLTKIMNNIAEFGVLPVDYSVVVPTKVEVRTLIETAKQALAFYKDYASSLKAVDIKIVADAQFQQDLTDLINKALESQLVSQVFMNIVNGASRIVTKNHGKLEIGGTMTADEFVNVALPDLFDMISYAEELGVLGGGIKLKNVEAIINLAKLGVTSPATKDLVNDIVPVALRKILNINITKEELVAANIDFVTEVSYLEAFLRGIEDEFQVVELSDPNSLLSTDFLKAVAVAGKELENSEFLELIIKPVLSKGVNKISKANNMFDFMLTALESDTYTNAQAMEDYSKLLNIIEISANVNIFESLDLSVLNAHIEGLLDNLFAMHAAKGHEASIMRNILDKCTFVDTSKVDLESITDWSEEVDDFTNALQVIEASGLLVPGADIAGKVATMTQADIEAFLLAFNKSEILRPLIAETAYKAIINVTSALGFGEATVSPVIEAKYAWLHEQAKGLAPISDEARYEAEIAKIAGYIANPLTLIL